MQQKNRQNRNNDFICLQLHFNIKISFCIVKANILNYLSKCIKIIRKFAVFNPLTKHIAKNTSEIFVTRV